MRRVLSNGVEAVCLLLMAVLAIDLMLGVFSRYVLFSTFTWYDEIARGCFVWMVFLGAAVGVKRGSHFGLHLLVDSLPAKLKYLSTIITYVVVIGFSLVLVVQGGLFLELGRYQQLPVMGISKAWVYAAMPVGGALMVGYATRLLWQHLREPSP